jgi:hypothetical protein
MSLNVNQLEKVRRLGGGLIQARCPACAEAGGDRAGEHLRIQADGRFGCCVHPKDSEHRKRIFALAGDRSPRSFTVKVKSSPMATPIARSVAAALTGYGRTLRTAKTESETSGREASQVSQLHQSLAALSFRTLRTAISHPRAYAREDHICVHTCKDLESGVLSVLTAEDWRRRHPTALIDENGRPLPYVRSSGTLVIPFDSDERFHYWKGGQSLALTRQEAISRKEMQHGTGV